ncbi:RnfABCDGE type electron transport complex subunit B [Blautia liquoris]|uniref:Ion-translocating oxidoreductase complex subunit B n=1 Tax=Blautia liquoris TaxID=2779518 RepID=A0A7M2RKW5_9FIRM|nr:RnfABCDGE type electron transport complex subunit B [Blautia liquoris]QOV20778.1 RnfABCDGE type electron transport complex subunit B [Blautia liquoris]
MSFSVILTSTIILGGSGILIGLLLGLADKKLSVTVDERENLVREALPGVNCGACGYPGCDGAALAVVNGEAPVTVCLVGGDMAAKKIGSIMGKAVSDTVKKRAYIHCSGTCSKTRLDNKYTGVKECTYIPYVPGNGEKVCTFGCMGYGSCKRACPFHAIRIVDGIAVVDKDACTGCGACIKVCPNHLIELIPYEKANYHVSCASNDKGRAVMEACDIGCIGCKKCERSCPAAAIHVDDFLAKIDYSLCMNCGKCKEVCPRSTITDETQVM